MKRLTAPNSKGQDAFEIQMLNQMQSLEGKFDVIIQAVKDTLVEHVRQGELGDKRIEKLIEDHVEDDKENFGELRATLSELNQTIASLKATVDGLSGAFIPWPWFIGTMITLLVIVGGAIGGVYLQLNDLNDRIESIEYIANLSE